jgi:hypothetical protein
MSEQDDRPPPPDGPARGEESDESAPPPGEPADGPEGQKDTDGQSAPSTSEQDAGTGEAEEPNGETDGAERPSQQAETADQQEETAPAIPPAIDEGEGTGATDDAQAEAARPDPEPSREAAPENDGEAPVRSAESETGQPSGVADPEDVDASPEAAAGGDDAEPTPTTTSQDGTPPESAEQSDPETSDPPEQNDPESSDPPEQNDPETSDPAEQQDVEGGEPDQAHASEGPENPAAERTDDERADDRSAAAVQDRPVYPEVTDRSGYGFTDREYDFAGVTPQQAWDMKDQRAPLGTRPEQWDACVADLRDALASEGVADADVRLKGSASRFCSDNPNKAFPQTEDDLQDKVAEHYRDAPEEERAQHVENALEKYREGRFAEDGPKPAAPFFDSMHRLDATDELSDYDVQLSSDTLANRFQQLERDDPDTQWRSDHGGHYKHQHLERVAPALSRWADRWENDLGRDVTIATFDRNGPSTGLHPSDWIMIEPEEERGR